MHISPQDTPKSRLISPHPHPALTGAALEKSRFCSVGAPRSQKLFEPNGINGANSPPKIKPPTLLHTYIVPEPTK